LIFLSDRFVTLPILRGWIGGGAILAGDLVLQLRIECE
jgi:hypothetical protein